jgi:hypothetical protein
MPVPASINDLSTTAGSNSPAGSETPAEGDNYIRSHGSFIALLRDKLNGTSDTGTVKNATFSGTMAGAASWAALQTFAAGLASTTGVFSSTISASNLLENTYTPTVSNKSNVSTVTTNAAMYMRVGNRILVYGTLSIAVDGVGSCSCQLSLPVASNFSASTQLAGNAADGAQNSETAQIQGNTTNDTAQLNWIEDVGAQTRAFGYSFMYSVI